MSKASSHPERGRRGSGPVAWLVVLFVTCLLLYLCQGVLWLVLPALLSVILYYIVRPVVVRWERRGLSLLAAVNLTVGGFSVLAVLAGIWCFPVLADVGSGLKASASRYVEGGVRMLVQSAERSDLAWAKKAVQPIKDRPWEEKVAELAETYVGDFALEALHWVPSLLLVPYLTYFLLLDGGRLKRFLVNAIPNAYFEKTLLLFHKVDAQVQAYFQGMLALTVLDAISFAVGLLLLGFTSAMSMTAILLFSLLLAVLSWVPYVGSIAGALLLVLVAATDFPNNEWIAWGSVIMFVIVRLLDDFLYLPMTVGRSLEVHPVVTVLMLFVGGAVAGISGLLLVMPVLGVVLVFGEIIGSVLTDARLRARNEHARALVAQRVREDLQIS